MFLSAIVYLMLVDLAHEANKPPRILVQVPVVEVIS